jgi:hypothetical protein
MPEMRRLVRVCLITWMGLAVVACGQEGTYALRISFPDEASRQETTSLYLWALRADAGTCAGLVESGVDLADATVYASLVIENPPEGPEVLPGVPNGLVLFLVEGRTVSGARILRGCAREEMKDGARLDVHIELQRICTPEAGGGGDPRQRRGRRLRRAHRRVHQRLRLPRRGDLHAGPVRGGDLPPPPGRGGRRVQRR